MQEGKEVTTKILYGIIKGLVEIHDRKLAHGDLKPGNILVRKSPLKAVLGDCGFVSIAKYAKVDCTATMYRDPKIIHDSKHDMYSLGICLLEIMSKKGIKQDITYNELNNVINERIEHTSWKNIILSLVQEDRNKRPTARELLYRLFKEEPPRWSYQNIKVGKPSSSSGRVIIDSVHKKQRDEIRSLMKQTAHEYNIHRSKKGFGALISYLEKHDIDSINYKLHALITLLIFAAVFGESKFRIRHAVRLNKNDIDINKFYGIIESMLSDHDFLAIVMHPPSPPPPSLSPSSPPPSSFSL